MSNVMHATHTHATHRFGTRHDLKRVLGAFVFCASTFAFMNMSQAAELLAQTEIAAAPPVSLRLDVSASCIDSGAVFKLTNRGAQWPRTGLLKLYYADDQTLIGQRRLRLADNQRVSFVVKDKLIAGRPIAIWVEPQWYDRMFEFDASMSCS